MSNKLSEEEYLSETMKVFRNGWPDLTNDEVVAFFEKELGYINQSYELYLKSVDEPDNPVYQGHTPDALGHCLEMMY